ncbi:hypothetical protein [Salinivirga cyanobacteriivorans]
MKKIHPGKLLKHLFQNPKNNSQQKKKNSQTKPLMKYGAAS